MIFHERNMQGANGCIFRLVFYKMFVNLRTEKRIEYGR